jgi:hypothetical protein
MGGMVRKLQSEVKQKKIAVVGQVVEPLPSKCKTLDSNPNTEKKERKKNK